MQRMDIESNRLASFGHKRTKNASKVASQKWPHPSSFKAKPKTLAEAGFYFDPSPGDNDNVTCFMCGKQLSDWDKDDDPFNIHYTKCHEYCSWALLRCGLSLDLNDNGVFKFTDKSRLPTSKVMQQARLDTFTFGDGWIHDQVKGHGASSVQMVRAGFVATPQDPDTDTACCMYCDISLSGWEENDDPMEEHRKRVERDNLACPFFPYKTSKPASKAQHDDSSAPLMTNDGPGGDSDYPQTTTGKTPRKPRIIKKGAKTPRTRNRSSSKAPTTASEDECVSEDPHIPSPPRTQRKPRRTRAKSTVSRAGTTSDLEPMTDAPPTVRSRKTSRVTVKPRQTRTVSRSQSRPPSSVVETLETEPSPPLKKPSRSKSKMDLLQTDSEVDVEQYLPPPTVRKTSKSQSKQKVMSAEEEDTIQAEIVTTMPRQRTKSTRKKLVIQDVVDEPAVDEEPPPPKQRVREKKAKAQLTEDESNVEDLQQKPKAKTSKQKVVPAELENNIMEPPAAIPEGKPSKAKQSVADADLVHPLRQKKVSAKPSRMKMEAEEQEKETEQPARPPSRQQTKSSRTASATVVATKPPSHRPVEVKQPTVVSKPIAERNIFYDAPSETEDDHNLAIPSPTPIRRVEPNKITATNTVLFPTSSKPASKASPDQDYTHAKDPITKVKPVIREGSVVRKPSQTVSPPPSEGSQKPRSKKHGAGSESEGDALERREVDEGLKVVEISSDDEEESPVKKVVSKGKEKEKERPKADPVSNTKEKMKLASIFAKAMEESDGSAQMEVVDDDPPLGNILSDNGGEVEMVDPEDDTVILGPMQEFHTPPTRPGPSVEREHGGGKKGDDQQDISMLDDMSEYVFVPPLSNKPFTNLGSLTEEELSMTVEQWIYHQIGLEYEKFKQDGEREITAFEKRAEEVRLAIEAL